MEVIVAFDERFREMDRSGFAKGLQHFFGLFEREIFELCALILEIIICRERDSILS